MSIRVTLLCQIKNGVVDDMMKFIEDNLSRVRSFPGCNRVTVLLNEEGHSLLLDEDWDTKEAHQQYIGFIEKEGVLGQLVSFFEGAPDIRYYHPTNI